MKKCFKCLEVKPLYDFYRHEMMSDGHLNKCKSCARSDATEHRKRNIDKYKEYDKARASNPKRVAARLAYRKTDAGIAASNKARRSWEKRNKFRRQASTMVNNAVRDGRLEKPNSCSECGLCGKIYGHHDDYNKPLVVRWLCSSCHSSWHKENDPIHHVDSLKKQ